MSETISLFRTSNKIKQFELELIELGYTKSNEFNYESIMDTILVDSVNKTYSILDSNGFINANREGKLSMYYRFSSSDDLLKLLKQRAKKKTIKKKQTKTEETHD